MISASTRSAASLLSMAMKHQMPSRSAAACGVSYSSWSLQPPGAALTQHLYRLFTIHQFTVLCLGETYGDLGSKRFALLLHPIFETKLFADDLESLVQHFIGVLVCAGLNSQIKHALMFG